MRNSEELMRTPVTVSAQQMETGKQFKCLDAITNQDGSEPESMRKLY